MNKYDTFWRRFFAGLIDGVIFIPIGLLDYLTIYSTSTIFITLSAVLSYSSFYIYIVYFHWSTGQTLGKRWMHIRVVDRSETRLMTFRQSLKRESIYIALEMIGLVIFILRIPQHVRYPLRESVVENYFNWLTTLWFLLEIVTMLTNERRRALHDILAGSVVIREEVWKKAAEVTEP